MPRKLVGPEINVHTQRAPLFIGRDPSQQDTAQGTPFSGADGSLLFGGYDHYTGHHVEGALTHAGLERHNINMTNRVLRQPWNQDFYRHTWSDINDGRIQMMKLIEELNPSIIVALGAHAAWDLVPNWATLTDRHPNECTGGRTVMQAKEIMDRRGFMWTEHNLPTDAPVFVTLHPLSCLYNAMPNRLLLDIDFTRLGRYLKGDLPRRAWPEFKIVRTASDLAPLWDADLVAYDIEITWGGDKILCIAFFTPDGQAFLAYEDAIGACSEWLRSDRPKLAQNGQFDRYYLEYKQGIAVGGKHEDTIVGHWACYPELAGKKDTGREDQKKKVKNEMTRKGLNFLASFHLNVPWWKTYTSDNYLMGRLCVNDVAATMWIWEAIKEEMSHFGVWEQYDRQMRKLPALIAIQGRGIKIDEEFRLARVETLLQRQKQMETQARTATLNFLQEYNITHRDDGSEYWWYHEGRCECCHGGNLKRQHCTECAGIRGTGTNGQIKKIDLITWAWKATNVPREDLIKMKKSVLIELLPPCKQCDGMGKLPVWDVNIMSATQMPEILWTHLTLPKNLYRGKPTANEETLRRALEWAEK